MQALTHTGLRILVVDDSADDRALYRRMLERSALGAPCTVACSTGAAALAACREDPPDCVLLDFMLPDLDGLEFLEQLRGANSEPPVPVVMLTGQGSEEVAAQAIRLGAQDYLVKTSLSSEALAWSIVSARARFALGHRQRRQSEEFRHFAHSAAHDLKAPLRKANAFASMLENMHDWPDGSEARSAADGLHRSIDQMLALIEGLLAFARSDTVERPEAVDLRAVVRTVLSNLESVHDLGRANVEVGDLPQVRGEFVGLVQVFQNLISNALKFNDTEHPSVAVHARADGPYWVISVQDDGIGIDPGSAAEIFEPFRRLNSRSRFEGTGLGLATCRRVVDHHGGSIECEPLPDRGTVFRVRLPAAPEPSAGGE